MLLEWRWQVGSQITWFEIFCTPCQNHLLCSAVFYTQQPIFKLVPLQRYLLLLKTGLRLLSLFEKRLITAFTIVWFQLHPDGVIQQFLPHFQPREQVWFMFGSHSWKCSSKTSVETKESHDDRETKERGDQCRMFRF